MATRRYRGGSGTQARRARQPRGAEGGADKKKSGSAHAKPEAEPKKSAIARSAAEEVGPASRGTDFFTRSERAGKGAGPESLQRRLRAEGLSTAKLGLFDVDGVFRGKYVSLDKLASAAKSGMGFCDVVFGWDCSDRLYDNVQVTGWHTGYPDAKARVDLSTFRTIPWEPGTAAFLLDLYDERDRPHPASPRALLRRVTDRARELGFAPKYSYEFEFFLFRETPESVHGKGFRDLRPLTPGMFGYSWLRSSENAALVHELVEGCRGFGIPVEAIHTETGPGVYEAAIEYGDILEAADRAALFKTAAKELCRKHGVMACFMAKWNAELPGCSGHVHQSLWSLDGERNLFSDPKAPGGISRTLRHFLAGQVELMPELTALVAPTVNSYKRYVPGVWAPLNASWGHENRTCALRVITGGDATRIEHRQPAADSNPYVTMAALLAAGLHGIERELEPPPPSRADASSGGAHPLPRTLEEAIARLDRSEHARELLGAEFVDHYLRTREWEARQFQRAVTSWELERYFEII
ncbi:glutamine synthetase family protein [Vulgatibacter incomptus]|uniref:Glutamine synthetase family protein n=1 Tax=Vulgatibacter incomptus TaxID=1391653 RepID=A0A0K1PEG0_9BACT|nr:glutamine synthetase family protein [Vulgatibacter incomptus]AKU91887.1 glutamine synthetase family protein [Vulgatibacter incomptus]